MPTSYHARCCCCADPPCVDSPCFECLCPSMSGPWNFGGTITPGATSTTLENSTCVEPNATPYIKRIVILVRGDTESAASISVSSAFGGGVAWTQEYQVLAAGLPNFRMAAFHRSYTATATSQDDLITITHGLNAANIIVDRCIGLYYDPTPVVDAAGFTAVQALPATMLEITARSFEIANQYDEVATQTTFATAPGGTRRFGHITPAARTQCSYALGGMGPAIVARTIFGQHSDLGDTVCLCGCNYRSPPVLQLTILGCTGSGACVVGESYPLYYYSEADCGGTSKYATGGGCLGASHEIALSDNAAHDLCADEPCLPASLKVSKSFSHKCPSGTDTACEGGSWASVGIEVSGGPGTKEIGLPSGTGIPGACSGCFSGALSTEFSSAGAGSACNPHSWVVTE